MLLNGTIFASFKRVPIGWVFWVGFFANMQERETVRLLQERLVASELKASEQRNKLQFLQQELKIAHKVGPFSTLLPGVVL